MRVGIRLRRDQLDAYEEDPNGKDYLPYSDWGHTGAAGRYVAKAARTYCLPAILWDCGGRGVPGPEHHYYFRHDTGEYYPDAKEAVDVLIKGWCTENASYTLQSVYDSAPRFP